MNKSSIELSNYLDHAEYLKYKARFKDDGLSTEIDIKTDIKDLFIPSQCYEFSIELVKLIAISKTKIDIYVNLYNGLVAKRVSNSRNGKWLALFLDVDRKGRDCATWVKSCNDDNHYLGEGDWVKVTFNEPVITKPTIGTKQ